ncbi:hypothetical protein AB0K00_26970 [Dactylosporangium sp. NPDC049525]|uniref:hypothetical protein n=1 Tax=Dactylosporangium sp. NPDC049525 TaxID=3154730 RepID=UPI003434C33B
MTMPGEPQFARALTAAESTIRPFLLIAGCTTMTSVDASRRFRRGRRDPMPLLLRVVAGTLLTLALAACDDHQTPAPANPSTGAGNAVRPTATSTADIDRALQTFLQAWKEGDRPTMLRYASADTIDNFRNKYPLKSTEQFELGSGCAVGPTLEGTCEFLVVDPEFPPALIFKFLYRATSRGVVIDAILFEGDAG